MRSKLVGAFALLFLLLAAVPAAAQDEGTVTVIHGVPGLAVDVWVNGEPTLEGFEPGAITDPLTLPAGDYDIEIYPAGTDPEAEDPAIAGSASLPPGANASIIAHLDADGAPTMTVFVNDVDAVAAGETRLTVRHTAAAPAVDVRAGGDPVFEDVANPDEATADLPAGTVSADVVPAGGDEPVLGPADVDLGEGTATIVYAIGVPPRTSLWARPWHRPERERPTSWRVPARAGGWRQRSRRGLAPRRHRRRHGALAARRAAPVRGRGRHRPRAAGRGHPRSRPPGPRRRHVPPRGRRARPATGRGVLRALAHRPRRRRDDLPRAA